MTKKNTLIPRLRFPEFKNDGEWEEKKLGDIGEPLMCKRVFKEQTSKNAINGVPFYKIGTFGKEADSYISVELFENYKNKYSFPNIGDILISASGTIGRLVIYDGAPAFFQDSNIIWLGNNEKIILNSFLLHCYSSVKWQTSDGGIIKRLYNSDFKNIQVRFPKNKKEQQRIASCLSSLDNLIDAHSQKLDLLREHKKGLMQNLFPREGEKVPRIRFPEFKNDGEWEEKKLGEVYTFKLTNSLSRDKLNYENGCVKNIHYGDIHMKFKTLFDITNEEVPFISEKSDYENIKPENYCLEGDLIFADASEDLDDIGKSIEVVNLNNEKLVAGLHTILARQKKMKLTIGFGGYLFKSEKIRKQIQKEAHGAKVLGISATRISNLFISYPKLKEQQRIASCLSSLDELIVAQTEKIEQLKEHKKGLMQGLFPGQGLER